MTKGEGNCNFTTRCKQAKKKKKRKRKKRKNRQNLQLKTNGH